MNISQVTACLAIVSSIAAGVWTLESRYELKAQAIEIHAGYDQKFNAFRLTQVDNTIVRLLEIKERRKLTIPERELLQRSINEQKRLLCQLKIQCAQ